MNGKWGLRQLNRESNHRKKAICEDGLWANLSYTRSDEAAAAAAAEDATVQINYTYCNVMYCSSCLPESAVLSPKLAMSVSKGNMAWACPVCWEEGLKDVAKLRGGLVGKRRKPTGSRGGGTAKKVKKKGNGAKSKAKDKDKAKKRKHGS